MSSQELFLPLLADDGPHPKDVNSSDVHCFRINRNKNR